MVASKYFSVRAMNDGALCRDVVVNFPKVCKEGERVADVRGRPAISVGNLLQEIEKTPKAEENVN